MITEKVIRSEVKKYIDTADLKLVKMMHAMLEVDADDNWWDAMPSSIKKDVDIAIKESEKAQVIPHAEIKKRYQKRIVK